MVLPPADDPPVPAIRRSPLFSRRSVPAVAPGVARAEAEAFAGLWSELRTAASAHGSPEQGVQLVSRLRRRVTAIAERAATRPRVLTACVLGADPPAGAGGWTRLLLALAGGEDALAGAVAPGAPLPPGALAAADPEVVVLAAREEGPDLGHARALASSAEWRALRAVREGRVVLVGGGGFLEKPGPRVAEALEILAEALHPEAFRFGHEGSGWVRVPAPAASAATAPGPRPGERSAR